MRTSRLRFPAWLVAAAVALLTSVRAQTIVFNPISGVGDIDGFSGSLGESFTVNSGFTISIPSIGVLDSGSDGISNPQVLHVALFYASGANTGQQVPGTALDFHATTTVTGGASPTSTLLGGTTFVSGQTDQFRFGTLTSPVTLTAGDYVLVAWGFANTNNFYINGNIGTGPHGETETFDTLGGALTYGTSLFGDLGSPGQFPTSTSGPHAFLVASFLATASAVPEPATCAVIFGAAAFGLAAARRIRRQAACGV